VLGWEFDSIVIRVHNNEYRKHNGIPKKESRREKQAQISPQNIRKKQKARHRRRVDLGIPKRRIPDHPIILKKKPQPEAKITEVEFRRSISYFEELIGFDSELLGSDTDPAIIEMHKKAVSGDAYYQYRMGAYYDENRISCTKMVYWYAESALNGCRFAEDALGRVFWSDDGESIDDTVEKLESESKRGCFQSMVKLAEICSSEFYHYYDLSKARLLYWEASKLDVCAFRYLALEYVLSGKRIVGMDLIKKSLDGWNPLEGQYLMGIIQYYHPADSFDQEFG
jgi:hypothetical protein